MMRRVLIANRGEIAVRIIRACRRSGIESVAVFSEADKAALHVRMADYVFSLGPPAPAESYLNVDKIITVAKESGAEAIHPGYGFLAENAAFAQRVIDEGLIWIGPPPKAITLMGDKIAARRLMAQSRVPVVPGSEDPIIDVESALSAAQKAGFPVLLKAVAGGGGKGMRLVERAEDWHSSLESAAREAQRAFGDGRIYWEKCISQPHHIEIQILGGPDGRAIALFERECSIQRRHQKVIEESPSPLMTDELRARMSQAAVAAAEACGYVSAGTVEFLVDDNRNFYFLEMNTRLQVEHPVTEMVTGVDLVVEQFRIACGDPFTPPALPDWPYGHAMEFRVYAEDPENDFLPTPGRIGIYQEPQGPGVRVDSGVYAGFEIPIHYDPMVSKLIVWGRDRDETIARSRAALEEYLIGGVVTTIGFHRLILEHPEFQRGHTTTDLISRFFGDGRPPVQSDTDLTRAIAVAAALYDRRRATRQILRPTHQNGAGNTTDWVRQGRVDSTLRWPVSR